MHIAINTLFYRIKCHPENSTSSGDCDVFVLRFITQLAINLLNPKSLHTWQGHESLVSQFYHMNSNSKQRINNAYSGA
jgi:hypothetical protein